MKEVSSVYTFAYTCLISAVMMSWVGYLDSDIFVYLQKIAKILLSDAGRWKTLGVPIVIGGDNMPSPVGIGLTDLPNIGAPLPPPPVPASLS